MEQAAEKYLGKEIAGASFTMCGPIRWSMWDASYAKTKMAYGPACIVAFFANRLAHHYVGQYELQLFLNGAYTGEAGYLFSEADRIEFFDRVDKYLEEETRGAEWWQLLRQSCIDGDALVMQTKRGPQLRYDDMLTRDIVTHHRRSNKRRRLADVEKIRALPLGQEPHTASDVLRILKEM